MRYRLIPLILGSLIAAPALAVKPLHVGWVERVDLAEVGSSVKAKMDTGAKTSSIDADIIDVRKTGQHIKHVTTGDTVVFSMTLDDGTKRTFEREVKRYVRIKKKDGGFVRRPVIQMHFCIGDALVHEEVNLANRENFLYPVLIGRNMMQDAGLLIDPTHTFMTRPHCNYKNDANNN